MSTSHTAEELAHWRKWYARQSNNRAWELAEKPELTPQEAEELVSAAHCAAWLWEGVGDELNRARAWMLLGQALGRAGQGVPALDYAGRSLAYFSSHECPDWELAFAHLALATAARAAGEPELFARESAESRRLGEAIADPEDQKIFLASFRLLPTD